MRIKLITNTLLATMLITSVSCSGSDPEQDCIEIPATDDQNRPDDPDKPERDENWHLIEITRAEIGNSRYDRLLYLSSLAGIVNRDRPEIFLHSGQVYSKWMKEMERSGYTFEKKSLDEITALYLDRAKGYVLVDDTFENAYIAASLAGVLDGIILTRAMASEPPFDRLDMLADATDKDEAWLADYIERNASKFNLTAIVNNSAFPWTMVDYAISNRYPWCSNRKSDGTVLKRLYGMLVPNSPHYGWGVPYNLERMDVRFGCEHNGVYTVPGINTMSMSVLSSPQVRPYDRRQEPAAISDRKNVHYAMLMFSDGDNTSYMLDLFSRDTHMSHPRVAEIPVTWMYPPTLRTNMVPVHNWYQKKRPSGNCFIGALSGAGYTFPTHHEHVDEYLRLSNDMIRDCGMTGMVIMDDADVYAGSGSESFETFMKQHIASLPDMRGFLYMNYLGYARWQGACFFAGDVPVVSFRYMMRKEDKFTEPHTAEQIAEALNTASRDVSGIDAYSAIVVHVNAPSSYTVDDMLEFKSMLDEGVVLVNADQFLELIRQNVKR